MTEVMLFADIEAALVGSLAPTLERWLGSSGGSVVVSTNVPDPRPDRLVKVTRTGGPVRDRITDLPQVTFECWAPNEPEAADLARKTRALVWAMAGTYIDSPAPAGGPVWVRTTTEVGGPAFTPDPETRSPRYQFTCQLNVRGHAVRLPEELGFTWEFRARSRGTSDYVSLWVVDGTLPAGDWSWSQNYDTETFPPAGQFHLDADQTSGQVTDFDSAYIHTETEGAFSVSGPYGIAFTASGTIPTLPNGEESIIDSGTVTYIR